MLWGHDCLTTQTSLMLLLFCTVFDSAKMLRMWLTCNCDRRHAINTGIKPDNMCSKHKCYTATDDFEACLHFVWSMALDFVRVLNLVQRTAYDTWRTSELHWQVSWGIQYPSCLKLRQSASLVSTAVIALLSNEVVQLMQHQCVEAVIVQCPGDQGLYRACICKFAIYLKDPPMHPCKRLISLQG